MADRAFLKAFAKDFLGINAEAGALDGDVNSVSRAVNYEWAVSNNLRGRTGCQIATNQGLFFGNYSHFYSLTTPKYLPKFQSATPPLSSTAQAASGTSINEYLLLNRDLFVLDTYNIPITVVSGSVPFTWHSTVSNGNIHFIIKANGVTKLDFNAGTGLENQTTYKTIYDLLTAINATGTISCTVNRANLPPFAIVNGNQTLAPTGRSFLGGWQYTVTVNAGHTFLPGDPFVYVEANPGAYYAGVVTATTGTTLSVATGYNVLTVNNSQVLGYLCAPAASLPIQTVQTASSSPFNVPVPYARWSGNRPGMFIGSETATRATASQTSKDTFYKPPAFVSASGCCYIATTTSNTQRDQFLYKYDGTGVYVAGLPKPVVAAVVVGAGAALTGTYRYRYFYRRIDAQGNIIESTPSDPVSITVAGQNVDVKWTRIVYQNLEAIGNHIYATGFAATFGASGPLTTGPFPVDDYFGGRALTLKVGDPIVFYNAAGTLCRDYITGLDNSGANTQMYISGANGAISLLDNTTISVGLTAVILRTTNGGTTWYELYEDLNPSVSSGTVTYNDGITDAVLTTRTVFTDPTTGKEHDPPPICTLVCQHQGGLVVAGSTTAPNTVSFSTADGIEYFPLASNSFDVPNSRIGGITAIASDKDDRLAVFKSDAYYDVVGDLDGGSFSINVANEGDYGITSQATLQKVRGKFIGLSKLGFVIIDNGVLYDQEFRELNARIINQPWFFGAATACNDYFTRTYICNIPSGAVNTSTGNTFVLDYSRPNTIGFERSYPSSVDPTNGFAMYGNSLYTLSGMPTYSGNAVGTPFRRLYRFQGDSPTGNNGDCYIDNTTAINYVLETQSMNLGEPSIFKLPIRLRLFSVPNDYIVESWVPFDMQVDSSIFPDPSYLGSAHPGGITSTISFAGINDWYQDLKLKSARSLVIMLRFTVNTLRMAPFLTGYELVVSTPYNKEDLQK